MERSSKKISSESRRPARADGGVSLSLRVKISDDVKQASKVFVIKQYAMEEEQEQPRCLVGFIMCTQLSHTRCTILSRSVLQTFKTGLQQSKRAHNGIYQKQKILLYKTSMLKRVDILTCINLSSQNMRNGNILSISFPECANT